MHNCYVHYGLSLKYWTLKDVLTNKSELHAVYNTQTMLKQISI